MVEAVFGGFNVLWGDSGKFTTPVRAQTLSSVHFTASVVVWVCKNCPPYSGFEQEILMDMMMACDCLRIQKF
jgi:hypothetical protein